MDALEAGLAAMQRRHQIDHGIAARQQAVEIGRVVHIGGQQLDRSQHRQRAGR